ncbi:hypothetical protein [Sinorhizobium meliloti]
MKLLSASGATSVAYLD